MTLSEWESKGQYFNYNGKKIFYIDYGKKTAPCLVFLHGYPTSSLDYWNLIPSLTDKYRVIIHDHLGFGLSDKPANESYLLIEQAEISLALYQKLGLSSFHLIAHDYGTSIATEIIAKHNEGEINQRILSVTLSNGSMLIDLSKLRLIQKLLKNQIIGPLVAKLTTENIFHNNMRNIWWNKSFYDKNEMRLHWELLIHKEGRKVLSQITTYIDQRYDNYERWIGGLEKTNLPIHLLWAENDPVAIVKMADRLSTLITNNQKTVIPQCGHYPMIEKGQLWTKHLKGFIGAL